MKLLDYTGNVTSFERFARAEGLLEGIEVSLELRFGPEGLKLMPEIRELQDHEVLRTVLQAIKTANSPDELRRVWTGGRRRKKRSRS